MLMYSMGASVDGFIADALGRFAWSEPTPELFAFHTEQVGALDVYLLGRRLYETMRVWETDAALRQTEAGAAFADIWAALPKVVFSRSPVRVEGNARLATGSVREEISSADPDGDRRVSIGGATLAAEALRLDLVDELHILRHPVVVGGGTALLPPLDREVALELVETRAFPPRVVYEHYRRVRP